MMLSESVRSTQPFNGSDQIQNPVGHRSNNLLTNLSAPPLDGQVTETRSVGLSSVNGC